MPDNAKNDASAIINKFEIETEQQTFSDAELFEVLSKQIAYLLEYKAEFLFSLLYRMDVKEDKVNAALHPLATEPPHIGLTHLVLDRQRARNLTREQYKQQAIDDLEEGLEY